MKLRSTFVGVPVCPTPRSVTRTSTCPRTEVTAGGLNVSATNTVPSVDKERAGESFSTVVGCAADVAVELEGMPAERRVL